MIENAISQALTKTHDATVCPTTTSYTNHHNVTYTSSSYVHSTPNWHGHNYNRQSTPQCNTYPTYIQEELQTHPYRFPKPQTYQTSPV